MTGISCIGYQNEDEQYSLTQTRGFHPGICKVSVDNVDILETQAV